MQVLTRKYCENFSTLRGLFPLESEECAGYWHFKSSKVTTVNAAEILTEEFPQLAFPIQSGVSQSERYRSAVYRGRKIERPYRGSFFSEPKSISINLVEGLVGELPIIEVRNRGDFESLIKALIHKSEPVEIPLSMGACLIIGYSNWGRLRQYRTEWTKKNPGQNWGNKWEILKKNKSKYQDTFIILSDGDYSAVGCDAMDLPADVWLAKSQTIRLYHELTHYFTKRVFGSVADTLYDEVLCDYFGICMANEGDYRADWFLKFMGLEDFPLYRAGGRLENYITVNELSAQQSATIYKSVHDAALNLESFNRASSEIKSNPRRALLAQCSLSLGQMSSANGVQMLLKKFDDAIAAEATIGN